MCARRTLRTGRRTSAAPAEVPHDELRDHEISVSGPRPKESRRPLFSRSCESPEGYLRAASCRPTRQRDSMRVEPLLLPPSSSAAARARLVETLVGGAPQRPWSRSTWTSSWPLDAARARSTTGRAGGLRRRQLRRPASGPLAEGRLRAGPGVQPRRAAPRPAVRPLGPGARGPARPIRPRGEEESLRGFGARLGLSAERCADRAARIGQARRAAGTEATARLQDFS